MKKKILNSKSQILWLLLVTAYCLLPTPCFSQRTQIASPVQNPPYDPAFVQASIQSATSQSGNIQEWAKTLSATVGTGDGTTRTFTPTLSTPVSKGSVFITIPSESIQVVDDRLGNLVGRGIQSGTVNYSSGAVTVTFQNAPLSGDVVSVSYGQIICYIDAAVVFHGACASGAFAGVNWYQNSTFVATEPGGNFIQGSGISITAVDNPGATRVDYTISATGTPANINWYKNNAALTGTLIGAEPGGDFNEGLNISISPAVNDAPNTQVHYTFGVGCGPTSTNLYVSNTGNDSTGDGSIGNPWQHINFAVGKLPRLILCNYTINLAVGTYSESVNLSGFVFGPQSTTIGGYQAIGITILGSTSAPGTYIITSPATNSDVYITNGILTLQGVSLQGADVPALFAQGSTVTIRGCTFTSNSMSILAGNKSTIYLDRNFSVNNAGTDYLDITNIGGQAGIVLKEQSLLTDEIPRYPHSTAGGPLVVSILSAPHVGCDFGLELLSGSTVTLQGTLTANTDSEIGCGNGGIALLVEDSTFHIGTAHLTNPTTAYTLVNSFGAFGSLTTSGATTVTGFTQVNTGVTYPVGP